MKKRNGLQEQSQGESCHDDLTESAQDLGDKESSEYESSESEFFDDDCVLQHVPRNNTKNRCKLFDKFLAAEPELSEKDNALFARLNEKLVAVGGCLTEDTRWEGHVLYIHHSTAIEGYTCSSIQTHEILKSGQPTTETGRRICDKIIGLDAAIKELPLIGRIDEFDLLRVHWCLYKVTDRETAGKFRNVQPFFGADIFPSWKVLPKLMVKWCHWINQQHSNLHPVALAIIAYLSLVFVHPFVEGTEKVARLFMNLVLIRHGFPLTIIQYDDHPLYYDCLEQAFEMGDIIPLIQFITKCTDRTLDFYLTNNLSTVDNLDL